MIRKRIFALICAAALLCVVLAAVSGSKGKEYTVVYPSVRYGNEQSTDNVTSYLEEAQEEQSPVPEHPVVNTMPPAWAKVWTRRFPSRSA